MVWNAPAPTPATRIVSINTRWSFCSYCANPVVSPNMLPLKPCFHLAAHLNRLMKHHCSHVQYQTYVMCNTCKTGSTCIVTMFYIIVSIYLVPTYFPVPEWCSLQKSEDIHLWCTVKYSVLHRFSCLSTVLIINNTNQSKRLKTKS